MADCKRRYFGGQEDRRSQLRSIQDAHLNDGEPLWEFPRPPFGVITATLLLLAGMVLGASSWDASRPIQGVQQGLPTTSMDNYSNETSEES